MFKKIEWPVVAGILVMLFLLGYIAYLAGYHAHEQKYERDIYEKQKTDPA
jgi:hypothetical protein